MKKNDVLTLSITGVTSEGHGVARYEGIAVFVPFTAIGDICEVLIVKVNKSYLIGKLVKVITPSEARTENDCEYYKKCGGCSFRHINYNEELRLKKEIVTNAFSKFYGKEISVFDCFSDYNILNYRNKAQLPIKKGKEGNLEVGFYSKRSHDIIGVESCLLADKEFDEIVKTIKEWAIKYNIKPYDEQSGTGLLRHIYLRKAEFNNEIMVALVINGDKTEKKTKLIEELTKNHQNIVSIVLNINRERSNVILGKQCVTIFGKDYIEERLGDKVFKISPLSFFQVNTKIAQKLYEKALEICDLKGDETVIDLYCGIGTISLFFAKMASRVFGVEIVKDAIINARENAKRNNIENATFIEGDARVGFLEIEKNGIKADVVVLDPPRKGCEKELIDLIVKNAPKKICYISCDPATLARDVKLFSEHGYKADVVYPFDMFPRTAHVETVVCLNRKHS